MNAPIPRALAPEAEIAITAAVSMLAAGADPKQVARLIYELGYTSGVLDMGRVGAQQVREAFDRILGGEAARLTVVR